MLGPFELVRRLGAGGMAETFLAVRRGPAGFAQRVCVKRILPAYESDLDFIRSFLAEARTSAGLRHANIVQVIDFGSSQAEGAHYLALELIDGLDLRELVQHGETLDAELVTLIAAELAAALAYAHQGDEDRPSVIHRDVSPSNVLISRAGEVKLTDFGIARVVGGTLHTASGVIKGKVPYMPPEYVDGNRFDARGDLFALGVMLYELLHGFRPFDGDSEIDTLRRIASGERKAFTAEAPGALADCIERLLRHDPEERFPSAHVLLDALPSPHVTRARKRLSELARARTSRLPETHALVQGPGHTLQVTPRSTEPVASPPPRHTRALPSPRALGALAASSLLLLTVLIAGVLKLQRGAVTSRAVPALPELPAQPLAARKARTQPTPPAELVTTQLEATPAEGPTPLPPPAEPAEQDAASGEEARPRARRAHAELSVIVLPFGEVWVDGKRVGQSPLRALKLPPGEHEVGVGEGRAREHRSIQLEPGAREQLVFSRPRK